MSTGATAELVVGGRSVRYRDTGAGDTVVLVHGIGRSLEDWTEQHDLLSSDYRVISVDLPGFGWSDRLEGPTTLKRLSAWLPAFLDELGVTEPVHLLGNSLGGAVTMAFAAEHPERVRDLVLVNSAGFGREVALGLRLLALRPLTRVLLRPRRSSAARTLRGIFHDPSFSTEERVEQAYVLAQRPREAMLEMGRDLGTVRGVREGWRRDLLARLAEQDLPTLVVWGARDLILPAVHLEAAKTALPHARTHLFLDTGHMPQIEQAEAFAELVRDFYRG
ncbi:alpha/beta fold hydrolase [Naasia aerilata]|uniref:Alpha/beta hydrolase n=1 Tax=Naasia aerilata TaxID=1162966 RepID=A0ABM8G8L5_9MICO|nr:alpha/beta fold hydrolase [Naasia aerilata]BDZ44440.1 alpha/beta hydrolase [Naasia aerilata]